MVTSPVHTSSTVENTIAQSYTSSTRPIFNDQSSNMSDINGKAPVNGGGAPSRIDEPIVKVQPPRREDLQPSYARVIKPDDADADTNGWYGSMVSIQLHR